MGWTQDLLPIVSDYLPLLFAVVATGIALAAADFLGRLRERRSGRGLPVVRQMGMLIVTLLGVVGIVLALPVSETLKGQLLGLFGLVLTGVVAFSSTTFVANAMAGLMLRAVGNFRPGDWLRVGEQFGRVTERGIFHTEIQTEERDLATLPNLYLATNPVKVVAASGTIVTATVSLGYNCDHAEIEALLVEGATQSGLEEPFVHIATLGDFAVTYRVAGFLPEVKHLLSVRSRLQACVLDTLHAAGVEIVSPAFMNQRQLGETARVVPRRRSVAPAQLDASPEERIFDKAEEKASLEELKMEREKLQAEIKKLGTARGGASAAGKGHLDADIARKQERVAAIDAQLDKERAAQGEE